ncbi:twin-arginine translocase TatA/TatE family subunit [bacterium]|nr:twin-arginine translocase TatA/TatE family subunit [bacterium]
MFGLGGSELLVIALVALLVLGPQRLPEIVRTVSAVFKELAKIRRRVDDAMSEIRQEIDLNVDDMDVARPRPPIGLPRPQRLPANTNADPHVPIADDYLAPPPYDPGGADNASSKEATSGLTEGEEAQ